MYFSPCEKFYFIFQRIWQNSTKDKVTYSNWKCTYKLYNKTMIWSLQINTYKPFSQLSTQKPTRAWHSQCDSMPFASNGTSMKSKFSSPLLHVNMYPWFWATNQGFPEYHRITGYSVTISLIREGNYLFCISQSGQNLQQGNDHNWSYCIYVAQPMCVTLGLTCKYICLWCNMYSEPFSNFITLWPLPSFRKKFPLFFTPMWEILKGLELTSHNWWHGISTRRQTDTHYFVKDNSRHVQPLLYYHYTVYL